MRRTTLTAALGLTLLLTGCAGDDAGEEQTTAADTATGSAPAADTENTAENTGETAENTDGAPLADASCEGFFATGAVTLAARAEADRAILEAGDDLNPASWGEINLLSQRILELTKDAEGESASFLARINAPFLEASSAVLEDPEKSPTDVEISVGEIDVTDAAAAQEEYEAFCAG